MNKETFFILAAALLMVPVFAATELKPDGSRAAALQLKDATRIPGIITLAPKAQTTLKFPAVNGRPVLRFQVRTEGDTGWNQYLNLRLNGKPLNILKPDGTVRLLNRALVFSSPSWNNQNMGSRNHYNVFFCRSFDRIDPSITDPAQRKEGTWMVLDCADLCGQGEAELTLKNEFTKPLFLRNVEMGSYVPPAELPMALQMKLKPSRKLTAGTSVIQLKHGESVTLELPEIENPANLLPVLRFQCRVAYKELEGWGNYLNIKINDENLDEQDKYARSRLLNRNNFFAAAGYPDQALASRSNYLTFFTDDFDRINPKWIKDAAQLRENTWFVLRLDETLKPGKGNTLTLTSRMQDPNFRYDVEIRNLEFGLLQPQKQSEAIVPKDFRPAFALQFGKEIFELSANGAMRFPLGKEKVLLESFFTYPHAGKNLNAFSAGKKPQGAPRWQPKIKKRQNGFTITAECAFYKLSRNISFTPSFIDISDTFENPGKDPVGIILKQQFYFGKPASELRFGGIKTNPQFTVVNVGSPSNPTIFAAFKGNSLGLMLCDTVSRAHMTAGGSRTGVHFGSRQLALDPGSRRTLNWRIYRQTGDYWDFINQVRRDIGANFTIPGYGQFSATTYQRPDPDCRFVGNFLQALDRKRPRWIFTAPWFCYYDGSGYKTAEAWLKTYRKVQQDFDTRFAGKLQGAKIVPQFETSIQPIPRKIVMTKYPEHKDRYDTDGLMVNERGRYRYTRQWTVGRPVTNYRSYIVKDSNYYKKIFDGIKGAMEAGAGGIYFDIFAANSATYDRHDGASGEIDPADFTLKRRYSRCLILEESAKRELVKYIHSKGGAVICNGFPAWQSMTSVPIMAFYECNDLDFNALAAGHLCTPIGLSLGWVRKEKRTGKDLIRAITGRLKAGGLFFAYITELVSGKDAYDAINLMYPITIEELHAGWIKGKERTIAAVPGIYTLSGKKPPEVVHFRADGSRNPAPAVPQRSGEQWTVDLRNLPDGDFAVMAVRD